MVSEIIWMKRMFLGLVSQRKRIVRGKTKKIIVEEKMRTHREKHLAGVEDKELINFFYAHLDRAADRNSGALNNHFITTFPTLGEEEKQEKWSAVQGYLIQQNEDLSALRLSLKELHKRFLKNKRQLHNMRIQFEKIRGERAPEIDDVEMPDLWNVSGIIMGGEK